MYNKKQPINGWIAAMSLRCSIFYRRKPPFALETMMVVATKREVVAFYNRGPARFNVQTIGSVIVARILVQSN